VEPLPNTIVGIAELKKMLRFSKWVLKRNDQAVAIEIYSPPYLANRE